MKNITTMERIQVACEKYESNCLFDIQEEDVIKEVMEKKYEDGEKEKKNGRYFDRISILF